MVPEKAVQDGSSEWANWEVNLWREDLLFFLK